MHAILCVLVILFFGCVYILVCAHLLICSKSVQFSIQILVIIIFLSTLDPKNSQ